VFFQTEESLLPEDTNGRLDVYQWENGHLALLSTGRSEGESFFGDASETGEDVFIFTRQQLVGQDTDENMDVYDARVGGGIASQTPFPPPTPCGESSCHETTPTPPTFPQTASEGLSSEGNVEPVPATRPKPEAPTRTQLLARALKKCHARRGAARRRCERQARKKYGRTAGRRAHGSGSRNHGGAGR
jgi:hypothetical protein